MDDEPFCSDNDCRVINKLSAMLKDISQTEITRCLTLSARCLQVLYKGFRHVQNASCIKLVHEEEFFNSLTHLQDIVQNTKELMIFESGETIQGHVNCSDFLSITSLEVKCLPLYQLYGLCKVAPNLRKMTCIGCINRIQELLELCGADAFRASDVLWSKLKEVHLAYNNLQSLDSSLKLVAQLTHFDASHNNLSSTDDFLTVLNNLINVNLSYNSLRTFPEISRSANRHLTHLNLRNNLLTSLEGLSHLFCLQYLDVSNNLLTASTTLNNLRSLLMLYCLVLAGNPVSFHPSYRVIIIECLHPAVIAQIKFDGVKLSKKEKKQFDQLQAANLDASSRLSRNFLESIDDSVSSTCDSMSDTQRKSYRRRKPRLVEITNQDDTWQDTNEFQRIENSMELYDSTRVHSIPSSSCTEIDGERLESDPKSSRTPASATSRGSSISGSKRRTKSKLQRINSLHLNSSNQDLETDGTQNNISITGNRLNFVGGENGDFLVRLDAKEAENTSGNAGEINEAANNATNKIHEDARQLMTGTGDVTTVTSGNSDDRSVNPFSINDCSCLKVEDKLSTGDYICSASTINVLSSDRVSLDTAANGPCLTSTDASSGAFQTTGNVSVSAGLTQVEECHPSNAEIVAEPSAPVQMPFSPTASSNQRHSVSRSFSYGVLKDGARTREEIHEDDVYRSLGDGEIDKAVWQHFAAEHKSLDSESLDSEDVTLDSLMENGFDGDFLVYSIAGAKEQSSDNRRIASVINNWLYVRTVKDVVERLDLSGLIAVQKVADRLSDYVAKDAGTDFDASFPGPVVRLLFDGLNQDKRERLFSMKDQVQGKQFARLLKSFIKTKPTAKMQCLRCDFHFDESSGKIVNADTSAAEVKRALKLQGASDHSLMHCPKCDSHFVIEVSERTGSLSAKNSQTMTRLDQAQNSRLKKRRKNKRQGSHDVSSVSEISAPSSFSLSFMQRRKMIEKSPLLNDTDAGCDDASAVDAVQFYIDPSEE